jgi:hypothetical protein
VVLEILTNPDFVSSEDFSDIIDPITKREKKPKGKAAFIVRGPTGRKAEEIYFNYHQQTGKPVNGQLQDKRDYGCGYDYEIIDGQQKWQIEVKGLDGDSGGIVFTSKEWDVAKKNGNSYFLVIVRNISGDPNVQIIRDPTSILKPNKSVFTTVQVRWNVTENELKKV